MREHLALLVRELSLPAEGDEQDWGVQLSDPLRLPEFLRYHAEHETAGWSPWVQREYADLVFQSAEEALAEGLVVPESSLRAFADRLAAEAPDALAYWAALKADDADPWLMTGLLHAWGHRPPR